MDEVFSVLNDISSLRSDAIYVRIALASKGVALGRAAMGDIPSTHRQMLLATGRPDVAEYAPAIITQVAADSVISGSVDLEIKVSRNPPRAGAAQNQEQIAGRAYNAPQCFD